MEEVLYGSVRNLIGLLLTTDDVVKVRGTWRHLLLATERWNSSKKTWDYDGHGRRVCIKLRLQNPIMDGIRRFGLHPPLEETLPNERGMER